MPDEIVARSDGPYSTVRPLSNRVVAVSLVNTDTTRGPKPVPGIVDLQHIRTQFNGSIRQSMCRPVESAEIFQWREIDAGCWHVRVVDEGAIQSII
jgi:hypothetical protein